jgi:hypothetical protein
MPMAKLVEIPTLFRGGSLSRSMREVTDPARRGRMFADHYITDGLMAKFAQRGRPSDVLRNPLSYLVEAHCGYEKGTTSEKISKHSPFVSFSMVEDAAWHFADRTNKRKLVPCELSDATHFMWKLEGVKAEHVSEGRFRFVYRSDPKNVEVFAARQVAEALGNIEEGLIRAVVNQVVHEHLRSDPTEHVAEIFDVVTYLTATTEHGRSTRLWARAIDRAKWWHEWLVFPCDPMPDGHGYDARFFLNEFLHVHLWARDGRT